MQMLEISGRNPEITESSDDGTQICEAFPEL